MTIQPSSQPRNMNELINALGSAEQTPEDQATLFENIPSYEFYMLGQRSAETHFSAYTKMLGDDSMLALYAHEPTTSLRESTNMNALATIEGLDLLKMVVEADELKGIVIHSTTSESWVAVDKDTLSGIQATVQELSSN